MSVEETKPGHIWVCQACGKWSPDLYNWQGASMGWDEACALKSEQVPKERCVFEKDRVVEVRGAPEEIEPSKH